MAQPPSYNRQKNFADDFGNETDHSALNAELDRASNSINDIRMNLAILQADDGKLRPSVVTADSISEELRVSLVEGVVMDAQAMLDRSLAAADASSKSAIAAKASEEIAKSSSEIALESAKALSLAVNADWNATEGPAQILNKPELSEVAVSGNYEDLKGKPGNLATTEDIAVLQEAFAEKGIPVGMVGFFATATPPAGYLKADGAQVGRETYPDLFAAIGTTFGEGDGITTFSLPDLINRFAQGSTAPGQKIEAGLPGWSATINVRGGGAGENGIIVGMDGALQQTLATGPVWHTYQHASTNIACDVLTIDPGLADPAYGASTTVQPPALTLLPCIKAFDAATDPGLIDIGLLAQETAAKVDKTIDGIAVKYVTETFSDGTNWYRKWSDGWLEQGGVNNTGISGNVTITFLKPYQSIPRVMAFGLEDSPTTGWWMSGARTPTTLYVAGSVTGYQLGFDWYACGY